MVKTVNKEKSFTNYNKTAESIRKSFYSPSDRQRDLEELRIHESSIKEHIATLRGEILNAEKEFINAKDAATKKELSLRIKELRQDLQDEKALAKEFTKAIENHIKAIKQQSGVLAAIKAGGLKQTVKDGWDKLSPDVRSTTGAFGLASMFGLPGLLVQQLGLGDLVYKGIAGGAKGLYNTVKYSGSFLKGFRNPLAKNQINNIPGDISTQSNSEANDSVEDILLDEGKSKKTRGGAGNWNKTEKAQAPLIHIAQTTDQILAILKGDKKPKKKTKDQNDEDEEQNADGGGFWSNFLGSFLGNTVGGKGLKGKLLKGAITLAAGGAAAYGLNKLYESMLPEEMDQYSEAATTGSLYGVAKPAGNAAKKYNRLASMQEAKAATNGGKGASKAVKGIAKGSKFIKGAGLVGAAVGTGMDVYQGYEEYKDAAARGDTIGKQKAAAGTVGRVGGGLAGAAAGAALGATLGTVVPGIGNLVGAGLGFILGGLGALGGSYLGDKAGRAGVDAYHGLADKSEDEEINYGTEQNNNYNSLQLESEERLDLLRNINNALSQLNLNLSPDTQRYLDGEYLNDIKKLSPAPQPSSNNLMLNQDLSMNSPFSVN